MKIAVFGANGRTGQCVIREARLQGHDVLALVRNKDSMPETDKQVVVKQVDLTSVDDVCEQLGDECAAVISCIGAQPKLFSEISVCRTTIEVITQAMKKRNIKKLIVMSAAGARKTSVSTIYIEWFLRPFIFGRIYEDHVAMEEYLKEKCEDLEYVIIKPAELKIGTAVEDDQTVIEAGEICRAVLPRFQIPRENVAKLMVKCVTSDEWNKKAVVIGIGVKS